MGSCEAPISYSQNITKMKNNKITNKEREFLKRKIKTYSYLMITLYVVCFILAIMLAVSQINRLKDAEKNLAFTKEIGEYMVFSAQLTNHCVEINNMTFDEVTNSYLHKMVDEELNTIDRKNEK